MTAHGMRSLAIGIILTLVTGGLFASMDAYSKLLMTAAPLLQVLCARFLFHSIAVATYFTVRRQPFLKTRKPALQALRGGALLVSTVSVYYAIQKVPLADVTAVLFIAPLIVAGASAVFLGEPIRLHRILSILAGLLGVLLIVRPGHASFSPWLLLPFLAACTNAAYFILTRELSGSGEWAATQFYTTAVGAVGLSVAAILSWEPVTPAIGLALLGIGALSLFGHTMLLRAFSYASAAVLSPFLYSQLVFAVLLGYVIFGDLVGVTMIAGAFLVVGAGLYSWWRDNDAVFKSYIADDTPA